VRKGLDVHVLAIGVAGGRRLARAPLDEGRLHTYVARHWLPRTWDERVAERFTIERSGDLRAAVDGEHLELGSQVEVSIEPRALRVLLRS
jgi:hypothetical protein